MENSIVEKYPIILISNLKIGNAATSISGIAKVYETIRSSQTIYQLQSAILLDERTFRFDFNPSTSINTLLKTYSENLILDYYMKTGRSNYIYDYALTFSDSINVIGNTNSTKYLTDEQTREELETWNLQK